MILRNMNVFLDVFHLHRWQTILGHYRVVKTRALAVTDTDRDTILPTFIPNQLPNGSDWGIANSSQRNFEVCNRLGALG
jgi:hypothetical protein